MSPPPLRVGTTTPLEIWAEPLAERRACVDRIAEHGLDHVFFADHVSFRDGIGFDAMVQASGLANLHPGIGVYSGVYLLALRHPVTAARQIVDVAQMAPGRFTLGVGVGGEDRHEIEVCGVDPASRGRRTDAALDVVRRLIRGETVDHHSEFFSVEQAVLLPVPAEPVPIVVGGRSDAAVRRAGRHGDGWLAAWVSPRRFAEAVQLFERTAEAAGREPAADHGLQIWVGVGDDPETARRRAGRGMEAFYGVPFGAFERYTPCGTPAVIADWLMPFVEAGCRHFNLTPCAGSEPEGVAAMAEVRERLLSRAS